jgi:hypothetical protein
MAERPTVSRAVTMYAESSAATSTASGVDTARSANSLPSSENPYGLSGTSAMSSTWPRPSMTAADSHDDVEDASPQKTRPASPPHATIRD